MISRENLIASLKGVARDSPCRCVVDAALAKMEAHPNYEFSETGAVQTKNLLNIYRRRTKHLKKINKEPPFGFRESLLGFENTASAELISFYIQWPDESDISFWLDREYQLVGCMVFPAQEVQ